MGARTKLNQIHLLGAVGIAAIVVSARVGHRPRAWPAGAAEFG